MAKGQVETADTFDSEMARIIEDEAERFGEDLDTAWTEEEESDGNEDTSDTETASDEEEETDEYREEDTNAVHRAARKDSSKGTGKRPGIDTVLKHLDQENPEYAKIVRGIQGQMTRVNQDFASLKGELQEAIAEAKALTQEPEGPSEEEAVLDELKRKGWTDGHIEDVRRLLNASGYIRQDDVKHQEHERQLDEIADADMKRALTEFGEDFGVEEDGEVQINPEVRDTLKRRMDAMEGDRGVTPRDLYILEKFDDLIERAKEAGRQEVQSKRSEKVQQARRGSVVHRTSSGTTEPSIYKKGDKIEDVVRKAAILSRRELGIR